MIKRDAEAYLSQWYSKKNRKPLVIRGARQVGKSTLVREFSKNFGYSLLEINLEKHVNLEKVFRRLNTVEMINEIALITGKPLDAAAGDILFLDEIQATPSAIPALRYLYEEKPELHVIAAGSLLEFTLKDHTYSMPVGRIEYLYLGPLSFFEYVTAGKFGHLTSYMQQYHLEDDFSQGAHQHLCTLLREYLIIGGMPEAVEIYRETEDMTQALQVHHSILDTYRNDFNKYATQTALQRLQRVYDYVPAGIGEKFKYSNVNPTWQARDIRSAVDLLDSAGVIFKVHCTSGTGIPLDASADDKVFKPYFLDVGLMNTASGMTPLSREEFLSIRFINEGKIAEQFIAQHLRYHPELYIRPQLHYWIREKRQSNAEVDFIIQSGRFPLPVEVKAGKSGTLKSLHLFCNMYNLEYAVRFDLNTPSILSCNHKISTGTAMSSVAYTLINLPLYMVEEARRIAADAYNSRNLF
ncbi:MAG: ATP-binding protein [Desulfamplus sp.]|nr:ATP-binding protein [Desulfamplus sp.]